MDRNSRYFIIAIFAVMRLGAVAMPISNQLKSQELKKTIERAEIHWLLDAGNGPESEKKIIGNLQISTSNWIIKECKKKDGNRFASHSKNPAIIRYTSGTTGKAKGVIINHESISERIDSANKTLQLSEKDTVVWVLRMAYHFVVSIILYLKNGCTIALVKDFLGESIFNCIKETEGTFLYASPMHIKMLNNLNLGEFPESLKTVISTSTAISKALCEMFLEKYKIPIWQAYGIIEIGLPIINSNKANEEPDSIGHALANYSVGIFSEKNEQLAIGEIGQLGIKGPGMFDAYLKPALLKEEILEDGWFMTGDLASINEDGLIKIEGRKKSMINVAGNKVFPEEVEEVINTHPEIENCKVSGVTHRILGEMVQAEIILKQNISLEKETIISYCRDRLSTYKIPQKIKFVDELTYTDSGKLSRK